ncbi:hypothetical protein ME793_17030 [Lactobacillus delbrueckii]|nr:hypothetical protein ME786_10860 [Lactobacillus delbrueckii]GHN26997.1 hypothetical protein ME787_17120 [Lactobacillus delbrueckii]GHN28489.1 hypothetical protein ME788_13010 [Lactobacillus delbrueckii]GHN38473.1 hypothetical protein ME793_17030 [Lactobacillus delbrueckii]
MNNERKEIKTDENILFQSRIKMVLFEPSSYARLELGDAGGSGMAGGNPSCALCEDACSANLFDPCVNRTMDSTRLGNPCNFRIAVGSGVFLL